MALDGLFALVEEPPGGAPGPPVGLTLCRELNRTPRGEDLPRERVRGEQAEPDNKALAAEGRGGGRSGAQ